ncbi:hypothetical protein [Colwellia sp. Bg11-28]|uniref:hypothetical protein n=1 Tax=Colwellia sp. Bg11-28 TaxID=2058305 RepID=UPI000C346060|nr:hypothetical protein [Colwellia sp. Bg11-28]PKH88273.1 hypothetical protein CXF79_05785 [Colwellia sp. Bg11-28]
MAMKKDWYPLKELAEIWKCTVNDLLYLGSTDQLKLSFDWTLLHAPNLTIEVAQPFKLTFMCIADTYFCEYHKQIQHIRCPSSPPNYTKDITSRLAYLSSRDVAILIKFKEVSIVSGELSSSEYFDVDYDEDINNPIYPQINIDDIVITAKSMHEYKQKISSKPTDLEEDSTTNSPSKTRLINNLYRIIGLLAKALMVKDEQKIKPGNKPNIAGIAKHIIRFLPSDPFGQVESQGLSDRSLRDQITKGLDSLNNN